MIEEILYEVWHSPTLLFHTLIFTTTLLVATLLIPKCLKNHKKNTFLLKQFPSAERHWLWGSINRHVFKGLGPKFFQMHVERATKFKHCNIMWMGYFTSNMTLLHPETASALLARTDPKAAVYKESLSPWIGEGLLIKNGAVWKRARRMLTPAFHFDILKSYMSIYNEAADIFMEKLDTMKSEKVSFELFNHVSLMTLDIILRCSFSFETDCQRTKNPYIDAVYELTEIWNRMMSRPLTVIFPFLFRWSPERARFRELCNLVHREAENVIDSRKKELEESGGVLLPRKSHLDFLDILLNARDEDGNGMDKEDMRAEVDTFMFEGHDTTATGVSWTLYLLAKHPEYQTLAQQEVDSLMQGRQDTTVTWDDLKKLPYLTRCIKESMRLHPPVPIIGREITEDLEVMPGKVIPSGTFVAINIWSIHHNTHVWGDDHMEYKPDRFLHENMKNMHSHAFIPFASGPRNCIGQNFAMNEEKVLIARLLHRYTFKIADDSPEPHIQFRIVLKVEKDLKLLATPRHQTDEL